MTVNNREIGTILTTEQLKKMDGMPVWSDDLGVFGIVNVDAVGMFKDIPFLVGPNFNYDIEKRGLRLYEATCFGHPLERVRELVEADKAGRCFITPFVAMVEQSLMNGEMKPERDQRFNGRYAVVYFDPEKWKAPLIDICGIPYNRDQAEERAQQLTRETAKKGSGRNGGKPEWLSISKNQSLSPL